MLEEPNIDSPNSNAMFSTQTADPVAEPSEKLCEIVADTKAAIEPELYVYIVIMPVIVTHVEMTLKTSR